MKLKVVLMLWQVSLYRFCRKLKDEINFWVIDKDAFSHSEENSSLFTDLEKNSHTKKALITTSSLPRKNKSLIWELGKQEGFCWNMCLR
jgi:DNA polymerase III psi subunit